MIPLMRFSMYFPGTGISKTSCHKIYTNNSIFRIVCIVKYTANQQPHNGNLYSYVGWLVVFNVPSTARSFRDGTPIYCPLRRT